jgi:hypothetical protein
MTYAKEVQKQYRLWPIWTPIRRLRIGDCGPLEEGIFFKRKRHVTDYGVSKAALKAIPAERDPGLRFKTKRAVKVATQAHGANAAIPGIAPGEAGVRVTFSREKATFLEAVGVTERQLRDEKLLEDELRALVEQGRFPPEYVVITDIVRATAARVYISTGGDQSLVVRAGTGAAMAGLEIASVAAQFSGTITSDVGAEFDGSKGATPLYRPMGFNIGGWMRRAARRVISPRDRLPRIVVRSIRKQPQVGQPLAVQPLSTQEIAIAPVAAEPFVSQPAAAESVVVEPVLVDTAALLGDAAARVELDLGSLDRRGVLLASLDKDASTRKLTMVRPIYQSPVIIQPLGGDPFLATIRAGETLALARPTVALDPADTVIATSAWEDPREEPLGFGYVDFQEELADVQGT